MKQIIIALAITAFATSGAQAQNCNTVKKHTVKHRTTTSTAALPATTSTTTTQICRVVPYKVCKIQSDRKTVKCYETTDLDNLTPMNDVVTTYGPDGPMPDAVKPQPVNTVVVPGAPKSQYCKRDDKKKETDCFLNGQAMKRDANGNYSY